MKLFLLSRYDRLGASSRLRLLQYERFAEKGGLETVHAPFLPDLYLTDQYAARRSGPFVVAGSYLRRARARPSFAKADLLWIEKEVLPWMPWAVERAVLPGGVPFVVDFDDAVFHRYDMHRSTLVRRVLGRKLDRLMAAATLVTAGNAYLAQRARRAGARWVEIVPTVVNTETYLVREDRVAGGEPRIGWIGSPSTWAEYVVPMIPMLSDVAAAEGARVLAVGAGRAAEAHPLLDSVPWSEETEVARILEMDLGLMPLDDTPWARGKCGYKLIQYMACGLPVIASPVGVNSEIVEHGVNGFLAETEAEWRSALTRLLRDPVLRRRMGQAGRAKVEAQYSLKVWGPRVVDMLTRAAVRGAPE